MTPYDRYRAVRHFASLDALRCLGIVGVIWQHSPPIRPGTVPFTDPGASGVALFFALSGFLITTLLLREESATGNINLRNFYMRRTLRIFPLYYAVLALYTVLVLLFENNAAGRLFISNFPYYLTYTSNWFVDLKLNDDGQRRVIFIFAWSLATEEQFYLLWPSIMKLLRRHLAITLLVFVMIVDVAMEFAFGRMDVPANSWERILRIAMSPSTEICAGVLLALALHSKQGYEFAWRWCGYRWSAPMAAVLAVVVVTWPGEASTGWYLAQSAVFTLLMITCVIREDHGLARILRARVLVRIGVVSYGMYLLHSLAVNVVKVALPHLGIESAPLAFALALMLAYVAAEISYRFFESPILRLKERFRSSRDEQAVAR